MRRIPEVIQKSGICQGGGSYFLSGTSAHFASTRREQRQKICRIANAAKSRFLNYFRYIFWVLLSCFVCSLNAISPPLQEILDLFGVDVETAQERWMQQGKERWEFDKRYEYMRAAAWPLFEKAGIVHEAAPQNEHYDYALVYGCLLTSIKKRIGYLSDLWKRGIRFDQIVFLTGERPLLESERELCPVKMESEMVEWAYRNSDLPKDIPTVFINAPGKKIKGKWMRPQTVDTVAAWLNSNPKPGTCMTVSNQPYVCYQDAVIKSLLPGGFEVETVGPAIEGTPTIALMLDTIAKQLIYEHKIPLKRSELLR